MADGRMGPDGESTRTKLVRAAREQLIEEFRASQSRKTAIARAFAFLNPRETADRAGVARSAFYHYWGEPTDGIDDGLTPFERFVGEVFESEWGDPVSADVVSLAAAHGGTLGELVRDLTHEEWVRYDDEIGWATWRSSIALAAYGGSSESNMDAIYEVIADFYEMLLTRYNRRMRKPLTSKDLATAIMACLDGLWLRRLYGSEDANPEVDWHNPETGNLEQWSVASISTYAIVQAMTEDA